MSKTISDEYLAFVRAKPCLVSGKRPVTPTTSPRGASAQESKMI